MTHIFFLFRLFCLVLAQQLSLSIQVHSLDLYSLSSVTWRHSGKGGENHGGEEESKEKSMTCPPPQRKDETRRHGKGVKYLPPTLQPQGDRRREIGGEGGVDFCIEEKRKDGRIQRRFYTPGDLRLPSLLHVGDSRILMTFINSLPLSLPLPLCLYLSLSLSFPFHLYLPHVSISTLSLFSSDFKRLMGRG